MLRRKTRTLKAANLYWETFAFREKPVTVRLRPTFDPRRKGERVASVRKNEELPNLRGAM